MGVRGLVTDTWVVSEGGCASAASGDLRSGATHTILSYPILSRTKSTPFSTEIADFEAQ